MRSLRFLRLIPNMNIAAKSAQFSTKPPASRPLLSATTRRTRPAKTQAAATTTFRVVQVAATVITATQRKNGVAPSLWPSMLLRTTAAVQNISTASGARRRKTKGTLAASTRNTPNASCGSYTSFDICPRPDVVARPRITKRTAIPPSTSQGFRPPNHSLVRWNRVAVVTTSRY